MRRSSTFIGILLSLNLILWIPSLDGASFMSTKLKTHPGGQTFTLQKYKGKVILVNFWATWCIPCRKEFPEFEKLYQKYQKKGLRIIGVTAEKKPKKIQKFITKTGVTFPIGLDTTGALHKKANIQVMPTTILFDVKGKQVNTHRGYTAKEGLENIEQEVVLLLREVRTKRKRPKCRAYYRVLKKRINIRKGQSTKTKKIGTYKKGTKLCALQIKKKWIKTEKGWVYQKNLKKLK